MQLRLKPSGPRSLLNRSLVIKTILFAVIFLSVIILLDKINMPTPTKLIKQKVSNDKLITLK